MSLDFSVVSLVIPVYGLIEASQLGILTTRMKAIFCRLRARFSSHGPIPWEPFQATRELEIIFDVKPKNGIGVPIEDGRDGVTSTYAVKYPIIVIPNGAASRSSSSIISSWSSSSDEGSRRKRKKKSCLPVGTAKSLQFIAAQCRLLCVR